LQRYLQVITFVYFVPINSDLSFFFILIMYSHKSVVAKT
jgi:hypothetical protein